MAGDVVFSELLCFLNSYYERVPSYNIVTVISTYFSSEDICAAKQTFHDVCTQKLPSDVETSRIIARKGENKRRNDAEDVTRYMTLLNENKIYVSFAVLDVKKIPLSPPSLHQAILIFVSC